MYSDLLSPKEKRKIFNKDSDKSKLKRILAENLAVAIIYSSCFFMSYNTSQKVFLHFLKNNSEKPTIVYTPKPTEKKNIEKKTNYTKQDLENLIRKYSLAYGVDPDLMVALAYAESGLNPNAKSKKGAIGIMQIYPTSGNLEFCGITKQELYNPEKNIECGIKLYKHIYEKIPVHDEGMKRFLGLAAYNWGLKRIRKLIKKHGLQNYPSNKKLKELYRKLPGETRHYVRKIYKNYSKPFPI